MAHLRILIRVVSLLLFSSALCNAQPSTEPLAVPSNLEGTDVESIAVKYAPNVEPTITLARTQGSIQIDGELDDMGWLAAARARNFTEFTPNEGAQPPRKNIRMEHLRR